MRARWIPIFFLALACCAGLAVPRDDKGSGGQLNAAVIFSDNTGDPDDTDGVTRSGSGGDFSGSLQSLGSEPGSGKGGRDLNGTLSQNRLSNCTGCEVSANRTRGLRTGNLIMMWLKYYLLTARR